MIKFPTILIFLLTFAKFSNAQGTICTYELQDSVVYKCTIMHQTILNEESMLPVTGTHLPGYEDANVTLLASFQSTITVFPSLVVDTFSNLQQIYFSSSITTFNSSITNCHNLDLLSLAYNNFSTFSGGILSNCLRLASMSLIRSSIVDIENGAFMGLSALQNLTLSHNRIKSLNPSIFEPLSSLIFLELEDNAIEVLSPGVFGSSPMLDTITLRQNYISSWHSTILANARLTNLDLSENLIRRLDGNAFANLPNLQTLSIGGRSFGEGAFEGLEEIPVFANLCQLETLILEVNSIKHVSADSFRNLANLRNLILRSNKVETVDFTMRPEGSLTRLERLDLWNNFIRNIPDDAFTLLVNLNDLDLSSNYIDRLSGRAIRPIVQMHRLNLSSNRMRSIQRALFDEVSYLQLQSMSNDCFSSVVDINNTVDNSDFDDRVAPLLRQCFNFATSLKINIVLLVASLTVN